MEESLDRFNKLNVDITAISSDEMDSLKKMDEKLALSFPVLADKDFTAAKSFDVYCHEEEDPYEDHGKHNEPAYFLIDDRGRLLYQHKQSSPFGRPSVEDLTKTVKYIKKNLR